MAVGALALDIDGTITTGDRAQVLRLQREAGRLGFPTFINTARPNAYCHAPDSETLLLADQTRHHCLVHPDPPTSKVLNMRAIQRSARVAESRNVILVDDRPENVEEVRRAGFGAIEVDALRGIRSETVDDALRMMRCARQRATSSLRRAWLVTLTVTVVAALLLLCTSCACRRRPVGEPSGDD